jgi:hypothetical protein
VCSLTRDLTKSKLLAAGLLAVAFALVIPELFDDQAATALPAPATVALRELEVQELKLHGVWKGGACQGDWTFRPDRTFELRHYSPGNNKFTGAWVLRWDALRPLLILTCKDSSDPRDAGRVWDMSILQLNDEALVFKNPRFGMPRYSRVRK